VELPGILVVGLPGAVGVGLAGTVGVVGPGVPGVVGPGMSGVGVPPPEAGVWAPAVPTRIRLVAIAASGVIQLMRSLLERYAIGGGLTYAAEDSGAGGLDERRGAAGSEEKEQAPHPALSPEGRGGGDGQSEARRLGARAV
jgi:hypothetical protein